MEGAAPHTTPEPGQTPETKQQKPPSPERKKRSLSGDYWYSEKDEAFLSKKSFTRTLFTVIAVLVQLAVLMLPQEGLGRALMIAPSYTYVYVWLIFIMFGTAIYAGIMYYTRSRIAKRIPVEYAPKKGFFRRAFLCTDIFAAANLAVFAVEISFVCIEYGPYGLVAVFMTALALAASIMAHVVTSSALGSATLVRSAPAQ